MAHPAPQRERCVQCSKIVYPQERLSIDSQVYHKMCLRCKTCATTLAIHNYVNVKGSIFCKRHVPLEGSGPKINVHAELQLSPRPTATADGQQAAPPPQPRASPRQNALVPPLSPRSQAISTNYVNPRLSPRLPPTAHPANFGAPAVHAAPKLPPTAHPAPAVFVHTSSNHKVAVPEAFTHSTPPATSNMSHSASSEEEDTTTPPPPAPAAEGTTANGAVPRTESKERDRSRSDRTLVLTDYVFVLLPHSVLRRSSPST